MFEKKNSSALSLTFFHLNLLILNLIKINIKDFFLKYGKIYSRGTLYLNNLWPKNNVLNFKIDMMVNLWTTQTSSTQPVHYLF